MTDQIPITPEKRLELTVQICSSLLIANREAYMGHNGDYWDFTHWDQTDYSVVSDAWALLRNIERKILADSRMEQIELKGGVLV
jgi:hypothetical protein